MNSISRLVRVIIISVSWAALASTLQAASIVEITSTIPGFSHVAAFSVNQDGSVVAGSVFDSQEQHGHAFRWTSTGGTVDLGTLGGTDSLGFAVSGNGNAVSGSTLSSQTTTAFRWTPASGLVSLGSLGGSSSEGTGMNGDGSVVVGGSSLVPGGVFHAFRWTSDGGMVDIHGSSSQHSAATNVSGDGVVVVGYVSGAATTPGQTGEHAFRWTQATGMVDLGVFRDITTPFDVSGDGSVIVGQSQLLNEPTHAFRWTAASGFVDLNGPDNSTAAAISSDGLLIAGSLAGNPSTAVIWDTEHGMRDLKLTLAGLGVDMADWSLSSADDVGFDGTNYYIAGDGTHNGLPAGFVASLPASVVPEPSSLAAGVAGLLLLLLRRRALGKFAAVALTMFIAHEQPLNGAVIVVPVNDISVTVTSDLGGDFFTLAASGTNLYFGNNDANANPKLTANAFDLNSSRHYFQQGTVLPASLSVSTDSTHAYQYLSAPSFGAATGTNYSVFDVNQDGKPDTVFKLDFGSDLNNQADDRIVAYAYDTSPGGINVAAARTALIPEPSSVLSCGLAAFVFASTLRRRTLNR